MTVNICSLICEHYKGDMPVGIVEKDEPGWYDKDVRQQTAAELVRHFKAKGEQVDDVTFPLLIDQNEGLAVIKHKDSLTMARRRKNRVGKAKHVEVSMDDGHFTPLDGIIVRCDEVAENAIASNGMTSSRYHVVYEEAEFERIENDCSAIHELWDRASPTERKLILLLSEWQQNKAMGECTKHLRQKLYILKKQLKREGSTFNPKPWML